MYTTTEKAYAKINLYLDIESKRGDGYHNIISIMHSISLSDDIKITLLMEKSENMEIKFRVPSYCKCAYMCINGEKSVLNPV